MRLILFLWFLLISSFGFALDKPFNDSVVTLSNSPTSARFFVGVSKDKGANFTRRFYKSDLLQILAHIEVDKEHVYKFGNVFVVVYVPQFGLLQATKRGFESWDGRMGNLKAYKTGFLAPVEEISVTDDIVPEGRDRISYTGAVYIAYQLLNQSNDMIFTAAPYTFSVLEIASPQEFYDDKLAETFATTNCIGCHSSTGNASGTRFIFTETEHPVDTLESFLFNIELGKTLLINEVTGVFHLGGTIFPIDTTPYNQFVHLLNTLIVDAESIIDLHPLETDPDIPIDDPIDDPVNDPIDIPVNKEFPFTETEVFYVEYLSDVINLVCRDCHKEGSVAWDSALLYVPEDDLAAQEINYNLLFNYISADPNSKVYFKPLNDIDHGGGTILNTDSNAISYLGAFIEKIRGIHPLDIEEPTFPFTIAEQFYVDNISGIIQSTCMNCHKIYGLGHNSSLRYIAETGPDSQQANYNLLYDYILADGEFKLYYKPVGGLDHGGGNLFKTASEEQNLLGSFINLLRGDLPVDIPDLNFPTTAEEMFYVQNISGVIQYTCITCHVDRGNAATSALIYLPGNSAEVRQSNYNLLVSYIVPDDNDNVFNKPVGAADHGGGVVLTADSYDRNSLGSFIQLIRGRYPTDALVTNFPTTEAEIYFSENISPIIQSVCVICHKKARQASASALVYRQGTDVESQSYNFNLLFDYISQDTLFNVYNKPAGTAQHGGGSVIAPTSKERAKLGSFIQIVTGGYPTTIEPVFPSTDDELFFTETISPIIQASCINCHVSGGAAEASELVYTDASVKGYQEDNYDALFDYISLDARFNLFNKPVGAADHGGGIIIDVGSPERNSLGRFIELITGVYPQDQPRFPVTASELYFSTNISPLIQTTCITCHVDKGAAETSALVYVVDAAENYQQLNYDLLAAYITVDSSFNLFNKPVGVAGHGGGSVVKPGGVERSSLGTFIEMLSGFYPEDYYVPAVTPELYFAANLADTIKDVCSACHYDRGPANTTLMVFVLPTDKGNYTAGELSANFTVIENLILNVKDGSASLLIKPTMSFPDPRDPTIPSHGGGPLLTKGDVIHTSLAQLIEMINPYQ